MNLRRNGKRARRARAAAPPRAAVVCGHRQAGCTCTLPPHSREGVHECGVVSAVTGKACGGQWVSHPTFRVRRFPDEVNVVTPVVDTDPDAYEPPHNYLGNDE